eukprot:CAMPEP_0185729246 /NCGR_PEP_ID=MMETSP1171-20130828/4805_1 /TAXON_ID=374046 /ORGANISM="Helicotheca tamensis, Strain CCMP826" /LENGTH=267 /DNA_ID=CAMNT_0028398037 /DNA_START=36 /DNA_END=839 /DNA_ORIENTATION=-
MPSSMTLERYGSVVGRNAPSKALLTLLLLQCSASLLSVQAAPSLRARNSRIASASSRELENEYGDQQYTYYYENGDAVGETRKSSIGNEEAGMEEIYEEGSTEEIYEEEGMEEIYVEEEISGSTETEVLPSPTGESGEEEIETSERKIEMEKTTFLPTEAIKVSFDCGCDDASGWRIGLYLHDADPQDGALDPMISMSACPLGTKCTKGTVEFYDPNKMKFNPEDEMAVWPLPSGLAYDAQLLNEEGWQMVYSVPMFTFFNDDEENY